MSGPIYVFDICEVWMWSSFKPFERHKEYFTTDITVKLHPAVDNAVANARGHQPNAFLCVALVSSDLCFINPLGILDILEWNPLYQYQVYLTSLRLSVWFVHIGCQGPSLLSSTSRQCYQLWEKLHTFNQIFSWNVCISDKKDKYFCKNLY